jgi:hypothetical protein
MTKVQEIQAAIESLSQNEYDFLRRWFSERDWEQWDQEIETDSNKDLLDPLIKHAFEEKSKGRLKEL